ncbi:hypothetical protein C8A01DRAFT_40047 [Parachaetomium inaequale]|uniref:Uncharacterized protein n=1 Tax=Parachaetomium inaequale TaxID=2588326 RepID=A0AAN6SMU8_9PEZI|nr:hypothetical protein C8A01DRAFT_40047 [Parachaetomium inaequale]
MALTNMKTCTLALGLLLAPAVALPIGNATAPSHNTTTEPNTTSAAIANERFLRDLKHPVIIATLSFFPGEAGGPQSKQPARVGQSGRRRGAPKKSFDYTTAAFLTVAAVVIVLLVITYRVVVHKSRALARQQNGDQDAEAASWPSPDRDELKNRQTTSWPAQYAGALYIRVYTHLDPNPLNTNNASLSFSWPANAQARPFYHHSRLANLRGITHRPYHYDVARKALSRHRPVLIAIHQQDTETLAAPWIAESRRMAEQTVMLMMKSYAL